MYNQQKLEQFINDFMTYGYANNGDMYVAGPDTILGPLYNTESQYILDTLDWESTASVQYNQNDYYQALIIADNSGTRCMIRINRNAEFETDSFSITEVE